MQIEWIWQMMELPIFLMFFLGKICDDGCQGMDFLMFTLPFLATTTDIVARDYNWKNVANNLMNVAAQAAWVLAVSLIAESDDMIYLVYVFHVRWGTYIVGLLAALNLDLGM